MAKKQESSTTAAPEKAEPRRDAEITVMGRIERELSRLPDDDAKIRVMGYFMGRHRDACLSQLGANIGKWVTTRQEEPTRSTPPPPQGMVGA